MPRTDDCVSNMLFEVRKEFSVPCKFCFFSEGSFEVTELTKGNQLLIDL